MNRFFVYSVEPVFPLFWGWVLSSQNRYLCEKPPKAFTHDPGLFKNPNVVKIGKYNTLKVVKTVDFGVYLDGGRDGEILMPSRYVPAGTQPDDRVEVFVYLDSEDRPIATTEKPLAQVGEFAYLKVVSVNATGAFLNWGLMKDLLVPFREQKTRMAEGKSYVVCVYEDTDTRRIVASAKVEEFLDRTVPEFDPGEQVDLLIYQQTELGYKAIINNEYTGLLYANEVFQPLPVGRRTAGYVKQVRDDYRIDLALHPSGFEKVEGIAEIIFNKLKMSGGFLPLTDKSPAEQIYETFGISKKTYKKAVGDLYKKRMIAMAEDGIRLL